MLQLLEITVEIARAGRDPARWPLVASKLRQLCPQLDEDAVPVDSDCTAAYARELIVMLGRCGQDFSACGHAMCRHREHSAIVEILTSHLDLAMRSRIPEDGSCDIVMSAMDAMPRPLFIIEGDTYLIYANTQGYRAIEEARWLELENGMIRLKSRSASDKLMRLLLSLASGFSVERHCLYLFDQERNEAELWLRRLARSSDTPRRFLFSLIEHEVSSHGHYMADVPLSPRQRELAHYLLSGASLDESAAKMGISRRTAKDHLSALFKHSMTNRQSDLVAWLTRYRFS